MSTDKNQDQPKNPDEETSTKPPRELGTSETHLNYQGEKAEHFEQNKNKPKD